MVFVHLSLGAVKDFVSDNNIDIGTKKNQCVCIPDGDQSSSIPPHFKFFFLYEIYPKVIKLTK